MQGGSIIKIALIGLGKMGLNLALNAQEKGVEFVVYDVSHEARMEASKLGLSIVGSIKELMNSLTTPRVVWLMVPAGDVVDEVINQVKQYMSEGDIVVDGGNSFYKDTIRRSEQLQQQKINLIDIGTSGGISGARHGICAMVGGSSDSVRLIEKSLISLSCENGYLHAGNVGSGHYLKMIHNAIEYGMMQSIAEGFEMLEKSRFNFDYKKVALNWNSGSVIRSWLMELLVSAFEKDATLSSISGVMNSSGEGKWATIEAIEMEMSAPAITASLLNRYRSQEKDTFSGKVVSILRKEFGGHDTVEKTD